MPTFPLWWNWELFLTDHVLERMEEREVTTADVRAMLDRAERLEVSRSSSGRFVVYTRHAGQAWMVVVEPQGDTRQLAVVTAYHLIK